MKYKTAAFIDHDFLIDYEVHEAMITFRVRQGNAPWFEGDVRWDGCMNIKTHGHAHSCGLTPFIEAVTAAYNLGEELGDSWEGDDTADLMNVLLHRKQTI